MHAYKTDKDGATPGDPRWSVVIPAYNEEKFLAATAQSILGQTVDDAVIILVDNKSTDATAAVMARIVGENPDRAIHMLSDDRPGKIRALETGLSRVETEFVALCDADTIYPPHYLARAERLFSSADNVAAAFAFGVYSDAGAFAAWFARNKGAAVAALLPGQGHTGGYGHAFRVAALKAAGGYSWDLWPFMVADHEIVNRVRKYGRIRYAADHFCVTSARRDDRKRVDWSLGERLLYNATPAAFHDWFFYRFLKPRFEARKFYNSNLRARSWEDEGDADVADNAGDADDARPD